MVLDVVLDVCRLCMYVKNTFVCNMHTHIHTHTHTHLYLYCIDLNDHTKKHKSHAHKATAPHDGTKLDL